MASTPNTTTPRTDTTTVSDLTRKRQIADLITHIGISDPHLFQALSSLQSQNNQLVDNIMDLIAAIKKLTDDTGTAITKSTGINTVLHHPSTPGSGGQTGGTTGPIPLRGTRTPFVP